MEWLICMAIGAALWLAIPAVKQVEHRRRVEAHPMMAPIAAAIPVPGVEPDLEALAEAADAALKADALTRGLRGIGHAYPRAVPASNEDASPMSRDG